MIALLFAMLMTASQAACEPPPLNHPSAPVGARAPHWVAWSSRFRCLGRCQSRKKSSRCCRSETYPPRSWSPRTGRSVTTSSCETPPIAVTRSDSGSRCKRTSASRCYVEDPAFSDWVDAIRTARARVKRASGVKTKTIGMATPTPIGEFATDALAFKAVLPNERTVGDTDPVVCPAQTRRRAEPESSVKAATRMAVDTSCPTGPLPAWTEPRTRRPGPSGSAWVYRARTVSATCCRAGWTMLWSPSNGPS